MQSASRLLRLHCEQKKKKNLFHFFFAVWALVLCFMLLVSDPSEQKGRSRDLEISALGYKEVLSKWQHTNRNYFFLFDWRNAKCTLIYSPTFPLPPSLGGLWFPQNVIKGAMKCFTVQRARLISLQVAWSINNRSTSAFLRLAVQTPKRIGAFHLPTRSAIGFFLHWSSLFLWWIGTL